MKEYTLLQRVMMVLRVIVSILSWVSRIFLKMLRGFIPGRSRHTSAVPAQYSQPENSSNSSA